MPKTKTWIEAKDLNWEQIIYDANLKLAEAMAYLDGDRLARTHTNLVHHLENILLPYADDKYWEVIKKLNDEYERKMASGQDRYEVEIDYSIKKHAELVKLMDRSGMLLTEAVQEDEEAPW